MLTPRLDLTVWPVGTTLEFTAKLTVAGDPIGDGTGRVEMLDEAGTAVAEADFALVDGTANTYVAHMQIAPAHAGKLLTAEIALASADESATLTERHTMRAGWIGSRR